MNTTEVIKKQSIENPEYETLQMCPVEYTKNKIAGKWKLVILWHIHDKDVLRYGELKKCLHNITHKMLSNQLKELVADDLVHKELYHQVPPKTEYSLTEKGMTLVPILHLMFEWGTKNMMKE